jgi:cytochrome c553
MPTNVHLERSPTTTTCIRCHDATQDGGRFDEASYRAQVRH